MRLLKPVIVFCAVVAAHERIEQLSELTMQLSETIGQAETRARDEGRMRSELKRLQITAQRFAFYRFVVLALGWVLLRAVIFVLFLGTVVWCLAFRIGFDAAAAAAP